MLLRFNSTTQALRDACEDEDSCYNLRFRDAGTACIVSGPANQMISFLRDISNGIDLDSVIQDPPVA